MKGMGENEVFCVLSLRAKRVREGYLELELELKLELKLQKLESQGN